MIERTLIGESRPKHRGLPVLWAELAELVYLTDNLKRNH